MRINVEGFEDCIVCTCRGGRRIHHALFQKNDLVKKNRERYPELVNLMELSINKPPICNDCHTGNGGHITRKKSWQYILISGVTEKQINDYLDKCEKKAGELGVYLKFRRYDTSKLVVNLNNRRCDVTGQD